MKKLFLSAAIVIVSSCLFSSCEKGDISSSNLIGTWCASYSYTPPSSSASTRYQYSTVTFYNDKTGSYSFENDVSGTYRSGTITHWKISGNKVVCEGTLIGTSGTDLNWRPEFEIQGNTLVRGNFVYTKQ